MSRPYKLFDFGDKGLMCLYLESDAQNSTLAVKGFVNASLLRVRLDFQPQTPTGRETPGEYLKAFPRTAAELMVDKVRATVADKLPEVKALSHIQDIIDDAIERGQGQGRHRNIAKIINLPEGKEVLLFTDTLKNDESHPFILHAIWGSEDEPHNVVKHFSTAAERDSVFGRPENLGWQILLDEPEEAADPKMTL